LVGRWRRGVHAAGHQARAWHATAHAGVAGTEGDAREIPRRRQAAQRLTPEARQIKTVNIYTDGACKGNPGPGRWGAVLEYDGKERELFGGEPSTTNNRMELMAVIEALNALKRPSRIVLHTDSQYVQKGITVWLRGWKARGWRTASKEPVKNVDLW